MNTTVTFSTAQIRRDFLQFFAAKGHTQVRSAPLVPANDPSLLFTNSGMVQFKDVFLGAEKRPYVRAVDVQRCLRAGGKHNDLDAVGYTARHHTFFEMLGNWSFGDYFKVEAITWAWELLTRVWGLPAERLLVTVYQTDEDAYAIWQNVIGLSAKQIIRIGDRPGQPYLSDNFWQMADTGPCGPSTEIFYDHGPALAGGPPGTEGEDGDRFIEIWNLVFMQFDRQVDGQLLPLPAPCVDTGMGLERMAAVLQHVHSNYDIDLFQHLIGEIAALIQIPDRQHHSLRVIADHARASCFLIVDGVLPANEGRGYVLRRIIRRALRHGWMLGVRQSFFYRIVPVVVTLMGEAYPELIAAQEVVMQTVKQEEERFAETLDAGMRMFDRVTAQIRSVIPGDEVFRLYDTYGFPLDLTADMAKERGMTLDLDGFNHAMERQRMAARGSGQFVAVRAMPAELAAQLPPTQFIERAAQATPMQILALLKDGQVVDKIGSGDQAILITDQTPFYAESGGQLGDTGQLEAGQVTVAILDTQKLAGQFYGHVGRVLTGQLTVGQILAGTIDQARRQAICLNHSATHLLHAALRSILGRHVSQKGSLVTPDRLRFDFSHPQPLTPAELVAVEQRVNEQIRANHVASAEEMPMTQAQERGAMALFGEKYGERVRVLQLGDQSVELCGGTHVRFTGEIGLFKLMAETGVSAGIRRIEAVTGQAALTVIEEQQQLLRDCANRVGGTPGQLREKLNQFLDRQTELERQHHAMQSQLANLLASNLVQGGQQRVGIHIISARIRDFATPGLRQLADTLKSQLSDAVILLAGVCQGRVALVACVAGRARQHVKAKDLVRYIAEQIHGKGGGREDFAQGAGEDRSNLPSLLAAIPDWVEQQIRVND